MVSDKEVFRAGFSLLVVTTKSLVCQKKTLQHPLPASAILCHESVSVSLGLNGLFSKPSALCSGN